MRRPVAKSEAGRQSTTPDGAASCVRGAAGVSCRDRRVQEIERAVADLDAALARLPVAHLHARLQLREIRDPGLECDDLAVDDEARVRLRGDRFRDFRIGGAVHDMRLRDSRRTERSRRNASTRSPSNLCSNTQPARENGWSVSVASIGARQAGNRRRRNRCRSSGSRRSSRLLKRAARRYGRRSPSAACSLSDRAAGRPSRLPSSRAASARACPWRCG